MLSMPISIVLQMPGTLCELQDMLWLLHPGVTIYKQVYQSGLGVPLECQCPIALHFDTTCDRHRYQCHAAVREIAFILPGDGDQVKGSQDIILYCNQGPPLQCISDSHHFYPALRFVLLFPTCQLGWYLTILYQTVQEDAPHDGNQHIHVSKAEFDHYHLVIRAADVESNHILLTAYLYQEYVCETWAVSEQNRLNFIRMNLKKLQIDVYQGTVDAVSADWSQLGTRYMLPSTFSGSTHHMQQLCQDALSIITTMVVGTCFANSNWPEIKDALLLASPLLIALT